MINNRTTRRHDRSARRGEFVGIRLTVDQLTEIRGAAFTEGKSVSEFIRAVMERALEPSEPRQLEEV